MAKTTTRSKKNVGKMLKSDAMLETQGPGDWPTLADVAARAFEIFCARGCEDGYDVEDWLQAERELHAHYSVPAAPLTGAPQATSR